ncbi:hypothetical protein RIR_jg33393.t1 [Rhizophagus irregularis DAOM 181602=DAOM 197198]|nr:hypothetical protein RIR_jg33393.t1 [Rhizophagus irregularis DAOM 181602=DAOM 197198]
MNFRLDVNGCSFGLLDGQFGIFKRARNSVSASIPGLASWIGNSIDLNSPFWFWLGIDLDKFRSRLRLRISGRLLGFRLNSLDLLAWDSKWISVLDLGKQENLTDFEAWIPRQVFEGFRKLYYKRFSSFRNPALNFKEIGYLGNWPELQNEFLKDLVSLRY